jgi:hypothetical protein
VGSNSTRSIFINLVKYGIVLSLFLIIVGQKASMSGGKEEEEEVVVAPTG